MRTRVKVCGITRAEDALTAVEAGADAIGLVFYAQSPRYVSIEQAQIIKAVIPPYVTVVGLFVNAKKAEIENVLSQVRLDLLQYHGDETPEDCEQIKMPYCKAIRVKADTNLIQYDIEFARASALLLDAYSPSAFGGTGETFDWNLIPQKMKKPVILAGGLTPDNVQIAIRQAKPYAVDVSGGVEVSKGIKDAAKIAAFMKEVKNADV